MYSLDCTISSDEFQSCSDHNDTENSSGSSSNDTGGEQVINHDDSVEAIPNARRGCPLLGTASSQGRGRTEFAELFFPARKMSEIGIKMYCLL